MEVGVAPVILSGNILKSLFAVILTFEIVMRNLALKNRYDSAEIGMLASLPKALEVSKWLTLFH